MASDDSDAVEIEALRREIIRLVLAELEQNPGRPLPVQIQQEALDKLVSDWTRAVAPLETKLGKIGQAINDLSRLAQWQTDQIEQLQGRVAQLSGKPAPSKKKDERPPLQTLESDLDSEPFREPAKALGHPIYEKLSPTTKPARRGKLGGLRDHWFMIAISAVIIALILVMLRITGIWGGSATESIDSEFINEATYTPPAAEPRTFDLDDDGQPNAADPQTPGAEHNAASNNLSPRRGARR